MRATFHASVVTAEDTEFGLLIGFADQERKTEDYLTFQRAHKFDDDDYRLGLEHVYVERNDQSNSLYGGIQRCELTSNRLNICFDERGVAAMGGIATTEVSFSLNDAKFEELSSIMRRCFAGTECFVESAI